MGDARRRKSKIAELKGGDPTIKPGATQRQLDDICLDCHSEHCGFMVKPHIWKQAGLTSHEGCCCGCLEKRLKRDLEPADFDWRLPINLFVPFSFDDEGLLLLLQSLARSLCKPENALDGKLGEIKEARRLFPYGMTMRDSTEWFQNHLFKDGIQRTS